MISQASEHDLFVEEMSLFFEDSGLPRMAGRILGVLMVCDPAHQSATELSDALSASKGSISTMTRLLMNLGFVERLGMPGRRDHFYRLQPGVWSGLLETQMKQVSSARALAERGLRLVDGDSDGRMREMHALYAFLEREVPVLLERWSEEQRQKLATTETFPERTP